MPEPQDFESAPRTAAFCCFVAQQNLSGRVPFSRCPRHAGCQYLLQINEVSSKDADLKVDAGVLGKTNISSATAAENHVEPITYQDVDLDEAHDTISKWSRGQLASTSSHQDPSIVCRNELAGLSLENHGGKRSTDDAATTNRSGIHPSPTPQAPSGRDGKLAVSYSIPEVVMSLNGETVGSLSPKRKLEIHQPRYVRQTLFSVSAGTPQEADTRSQEIGSHGRAEDELMGAVEVPTLGAIAERRLASELYFKDKPVKIFDDIVDFETGHPNFPRGCPPPPGSLIPINGPISVDARDMQEESSSKGDFRTVMVASFQMDFDHHGIRSCQDMFYNHEDETHLFTKGLNPSQGTNFTRLFAQG